MDAFTVSDSMQLGICAHLRPGKGWSVRVGYAPYMDVPLGRDKVEGLDRYVRALERRASGSAQFMNIIDADDWVSPEDAKEVLGEYEVAGVPIYRLDFTDGVLHHSRRSKHALVLANVCTSENGELTYFANTFGEVERNGSTHRVHNPLAESAGVSVCAQGVGYFGQPHALLKLLPNSGFIMMQKDPYPTSWEKLMISWDGKRLDLRRERPRTQQRRRRKRNYQRAQ